MQFHSFLALALMGCAFATSNPAACNQDNCFRAVAGTRRGPDQTKTASADCSAFLQTTITPPAVTTTTTVTVTAAPALAKRVPGTIPAYASPCSGAVRYSSACSCFGILPTTITAPTPTVTSTYTTTAPAPTPTCKPSTCVAGFQNCNKNVDCYCFELANGGAGFCVANTICSAAPFCTTDADCSGGALCAVNTCCTDATTAPGVCLVAVCDNPARKLMKLVKTRARGATAAFR
ncbi:hypothetical protein BJ875DRAFT_539007 [Amylocarpus encephaloides]|uniref:Extracellular membrane protein CFEM domain-containing protein n=1 Tax=Amylocarpus encephaloides TaxID=45428 RepID=A0A9P7YSY2_9HELO|nr:hypothetical protein BJ875DRAFT_539007 [Amylocarpus encephaloides]